MRKLSTARRVAVIGNCQAASLARCLRSANPALDITLVSLAKRKSVQARQEALVELESIDTILIQPSADELLGSANLSKRFDSVTLYPKLTFYGFHPDFMQFRDAKGSPVRSACGLYHSKIVLAGFSMGITETRVEKLFNSFVYSRLGYYDRFWAWKKLFLSKTAEIGYNVSDDFEMWMKDGAFMHTLNHPAIRVIASVARRAMEKAGIEQLRSPSDASDPLARANGLPVYPEIARAIGIKPIPCFRVRERERMVRNVSVSEFIRDSFSRYAALDTSSFGLSEIAAVRECLRGEILH